MRDLVNDIIIFIIFFYSLLVAFNFLKVKGKLRIIKNPSVLLKTIIVMGVICFAVLIVAGVSQL